MAFSDAFARGYAIGDSMKKRKAASNFFEKFKELSANADYDPEDNVEAIKLEGPKGEIAAIPLESPVAPKPTPEAPSVTTQPPAAIPEMTPAEARAAPAEQIPDAGPRAAPDLPTARQALPLADNEIKVTRPDELDTRSRLDKLMGKEAPRKARSFTQDDLKELDNLAFAAGEAAGDVEVYNALKATTDSFIKGKIQKNLGLAGNAITNGDTDAAQKFMQRAYRFVPDGKELDIKKDKDGRLTVQSPWEAKDRIPLTAETIAYMGMQLHDPDKFAEMMQRERHFQGKQKIDERQVGVAERQAATQERMTDANIKNLADQLGISQEELKLKGREQSLKELNGRVSRFSEYSQGLYYQELANRMKAGGVDADGKPLKGLTLDDARETWNEVDGQFKAYTQAPTDDLGRKQADWPMPADVQGLSPSALQEANGLAQTIALGAPSEVSAATATRAALALTRAGTPNAQGTGMLGKIDINFDNGTLRLPQGNGFIEVPLPRSVLNNFAAQANARAAMDERIRTAGFPGTAPMNPLTGIPLAPRP